jgi:uncharacterized membrane protein YhaH (DUF805 family)
MSASIGFWEHFRKLASFAGREDRASFWPYAAAVFGIVMVAGSLMLMPMMAQSMRAVQEFEVRNPDRVTIASGPGEYSMSAPGEIPGLMPSVGFIAAYLGVTLGLAVLLYAAAVVRRLHDRGKSGAWGLMPLPFVLYTSVQMPRLFGSMTRGEQPDMAVFFSIFFSNMLYLITLVALIVLLAGAGDPEPNKYDVGD